MRERRGGGAGRRGRGAGLRGSSRRDVEAGARCY